MTRGDQTSRDHARAARSASRQWTWPERRSGERRDAFQIPSFRPENVIPYDVIPWMMSYL